MKNTEKRDEVWVFKEEEWSYRHIGKMGNQNRKGKDVILLYDSAARRMDRSS